MDCILTGTRGFVNMNGLPRLRLGPTRHARRSLPGASLPGASYPSQPRKALTIEVHEIGHPPETRGRGVYASSRYSA